jgi:propanol-preferring alcohol dehydrogenase
MTAARVAQLLAPREPLHLVDVTLAPPAPGEVRLRVEACAMGQLDWNLLTLDAPPRLPLVPGHEALAVVEAVGPSVTLPVGARVLVTPLASACGACAACEAGDARRCAGVRWRGMHADGALGTQLLASASALVEVPSACAGLPAEHLALGGGSLWTAVGAARALALAGPARVGVVGVGGVGHLVVQVLRAQGHAVCAADVDPERAALARELGASPFTTGLDAAVVCTPSTQAVTAAVRAVRGAGRVVLVGTSPTGRLDLPVADVVWRQLSVVGTLLGSRAELAEGLELLRDGAVQPRITVAPLVEAPARLWSLRDLGFGGRLVIRP